MKKRLLLVLPIVAFLVGCGETDPMAEVSKSLPDDVEKVDPEKAEEGEIAEYVSDTVNGFFNFSEEKVVYNLSIDLNVSVNGKEGNDSYSATTYIKGGIGLGYEVMEYESVEYGAMFVNITDLTVRLNLNLPAAAKEKMPIPENVSLSNVNLFAYVAETPEGALGFIDLSDHTIQDFIKSTIIANDIPEIFADGILDSVLGEKEEGSQYRPGKVLVNVSHILEEISKSRVAEGAEPFDEKLINHPVLYLLSMGISELAEVQENYGMLVSAFLPAFGPIVGIKEDTPADPSEMVGLDKIALVLNISSGKVCELLGIQPEQLPVSGVAGLLLTVGMEKGEEIGYALEELALSANLTIKTEESDIHVNGSLGLDCAYNDVAEMIGISAEEYATYTDATEAVLSIIQLIIG